MNEHEAFAALVKQVPGWLDRPIEDLVKVQAVGSVYLQTHKELLKKIKGGQIELAEEDRKAKLAEGQAIGEALLDVEARIGELLPSPEEAMSRGGQLRGAPAGTPQEKRPEGITRRQAISARAIARHPEAVEQVIAEAKANEDIPTKTAVLNKIAYQEEKKVKEQLESNESLMNDDARRYLAAIRRAYRLIADPPKSLNEDTFAAIKEELILLKQKIEAILG